MSDDTYNYDVELDDEIDLLGFGKYKNLTPVEVYRTNPEYIIWVWENTTRWCGSEELIRDAYDTCDKTFKPRHKVNPPRQVNHSLDLNTVSEEELIQAFEQAMLDTYGCFPKPNWMY